MKKSLIITLISLLLCLCTVFAFTGCMSQEDIDNAVNEATAPLNTQITALEADIAEKEAKITTLESEKTALTTEKAELEADIQEIEAEVTALETEKATLEAEVAALEEEKASLTTDKATLEASITAKNNDIATLNSSISALETEKATLTARVSELEESILAKDTEIAGLNSSVAELEAEKKTLTDKVAQLEGENEILKSCLAGNHVLNTKGEISYAWSRNYLTCMANGACVYCNNKAVEKAKGVTDGNKITATFENSDLETQVVHTVTTYGELSALLESGEVVTIRLDATLENIQSLYCAYGTTAVLDMNGNDITFESGYAFNVDTSSLTLKGEGAITAIGEATMFCRGSLSIEDNVTLNGDWYAIMVDGYENQHEEIKISGGTINAKGNGVNFRVKNEYISLTITGGTFSVNPSEYVDTENYTVTYNENGTWTVSCNHNSSTHTVADDNGNLTHTFTCTVCGSIAEGNHSYEESDKCICGAEATLVSTVDELLAALEQGGDIKLMGSISRPNDVDYEGFSSDVVMHLNGYDITITPNGVSLRTTFLTPTEGGSLTVIGDGTVTHEYYGPSIYCYKAELTVYEGTFNGNVDIHSGTLTITGGTFNSSVHASENSTLTITGGTFNSGVNAFNGTLTITGGTFNSYVDVYENSTLTITGGTFNTELNMNRSDLTITGGTFNSPIYTSSGTLTITGGTFFDNPSEYVDTENYTVNYNENGTWTVTAR